MALFRGRHQPARQDAVRAQPAFTWDSYVRLFGGGTSVTSTSVQSIDVALTNSVVWRCAMKNAATLCSFPVHTKSGKVTVDDPPIVANPAGDASLQSVWTFAAALSMYLRGGAYGLVGPDGLAARGAPRHVALIHPDRVDWSESKGWTVDGEQIDLWPLGPLWHCPMYVLPGSPKGLNPLAYARRSLFPGLAAQEFGANFFRDGAHPSALLSMGGATPDPVEAEALKHRIMNIASGTSREPILLPGDVKWQQMQVSPDDSQFIETMRMSDVQVCRFMGCPPEEVGIAPEGKGMTYANREQRKQDYLQELLMPMGRLEGSWSALLPDALRVKLSPAGLLQADLKARYESYKISADVFASTGEWIITPDEWRELEEREPIPSGGDQ